MKLKELCTDERPREKMIEKGASSLSNAELLAIMLRTGTENMNVVDACSDYIISHIQRYSITALFNLG